MNVLETRSLTVSRGEVKLFRELSFGVTAGEWLAVRGPNGSGKTTLLRCIAGLTRPDGGDVLWNGELATRNAARFHADLFHAGHLAAIKDDLSAEENLKSALALRGIDAGADAILATLGEVGLEKRRHLPARRLSTGQRRRIGLARLMLDPAPLWTLDEPLTALDDAGQRLFSALLARHLSRGGLAVIATHQELDAPAPRELRMGA